MQPEINKIEHIRRPKTLLRAARVYFETARSKKNNVPISTALLIQEEAELEFQRRCNDITYNPHRHILLLAQMIRLANKQKSLSLAA